MSQKSGVPGKLRLVVQEPVAPPVEAQPQNPTALDRFLKALPFFGSSDRDPEPGPDQAQ